MESVMRVNSCRNLLPARSIQNVTQKMRISQPLWLWQLPKKKTKKKKKVADNLSPLQPLGVHSSIIKFDFTVVAHSRGHSKKTINVSHFTRNPGGSKPQKNEKEKKNYSPTARFECLIVFQRGKNKTNESFKWWDIIILCTVVKQELRGRFT